MESDYTIKVIDPTILAVQDSFIKYEPIQGGKVRVLPNEVYRDNIKQRLEVQFPKFLKFAFLFNMQRCVNQLLNQLGMDKANTVQQFETQTNSIDQEIQKLIDDLAQAQEELRQFNEERNSEVSQKEALQGELEFILCLMNEEYKQQQQLKMQEREDTLTREKTLLEHRISKGQENLQSAQILKQRLENQIRKQINDCNGEYARMQDGQRDVEDYIQQIQVQIVELYQNEERWEQFTQQQNEFIRNRSEQFTQLLGLWYKYFEILQELLTYKKKIQLNVELSHYSVEFEALKVERPFIKAQIARLRNKIQEAQDLLPALSAMDSIRVIQNCFVAIDNNFQQVRKGRVKLTVKRTVDREGRTQVTYELKTPDYNFHYPNVYDVQDSAETKAVKQEIQQLEQQVAEKEARYAQLDFFENKIRELTELKANLERRDKEEQQRILEFHSLQTRNMMELITLSQQPIEEHDFRQESIFALLGCLSQYMSVKNDGFFMCCRCCYSKDLHDYTDIYYRDYVRVFINQYKKNNNVSMTEITLQNVQRIRLQEILDLMLDYEYVGAYRNQEGLKQNLNGQLRSNQIDRSISYNLFEVCNLYVIQEMIKLNFYTNLANEERLRYENMKQQVEMGVLSTQSNPQYLTPLK